MRCPMCRGCIIPAGSGRPPRWCSDRCRYRGNRRLRRLRAERDAALTEGLALRVAYLDEWIRRLEPESART